MKQFIKFGLVGTVGFIVDALILLLLVHKFSFSIESSRIFSFSGAVFVTWILNRKFTFSKIEDTSKKKEYSLYLVIQTIGACLNYLIFISLVYYNIFFQDYLIVSLGIASLIAMFFNFYISKKFIYIKN